MVASWRNGYAEDCKSLHPGSIPGEASNGWRGILSIKHSPGTIRSMSDFAALRRNMIDTQLRTYDVNSKRLLDAVETVGREHFIAGHAADLAYADQSLTIRTADGETRTLLQPMVLARMIQAAGVEAGNSALSLAGGTGYGAALLSAMGASVTALEASEAMAAMARRALLAAGANAISVVSGDLTDGPVSGGPFDVILIEGGIAIDPSKLLTRLSNGGRLVVIMGQGRSGRVVVFQRSGESIGRRSVFDASAAPLSAFQPQPTFAF
jgi:protein-L-isoaspartate(D-aspartate) O-methyltransferase